MFLLEENAIFANYTKELAKASNPFHCGDPDLDEFFSEDAFLYQSELLGKSYCWLNRDNEKEILGIITLAFDGIHTRILDKTSLNSFQRKIPNQKRHKTYPAILIGRLGVNKLFQGKDWHIGSQIIQLIKYWFLLSDTKGACRFILVDAYNNTPTLNFYNRNGFKNLYKNENLEKEAFGIDLEERLKSRILYFDLKSVNQDI